MVVTAVGDVPHVVVEGTGLTVPPQMPVELARSILSLLTDPTRRASMGEAARQFVDQHHSASAWFDKIMDLYKKMGAK
jgi:glycosyltransferase involved in cell wall biosynthesis